MLGYVAVFVFAVVVVALLVVVDPIAFITINVHLRLLKASIEFLPVGFEK